MALSANTNWTVDGQNGFDNWGGGFNPGNANMATDLAATVATSGAPVVTSASYTFVAGDVGAWVFIQSGTNWTPGWYLITSVAAGAATLSGLTGLSNANYLYTNGVCSGPTTTVGCATVASPTGGKWAVDYSGANATISITGFNAAGAGALITATATKVAHVGNILNITAGTNCTVGWYEIVSCVANTSYTTDRNCTTGFVSSGSCNVGGCLATPGKCGAVFVGGNKMWVNYLQTITLATVNVPNGCVSVPGSTTTRTTKITGCGVNRFDGTRQTWTASAISTFSFIYISSGSGFGIVKNLILNGASLTSSNGTNYGSVDNVKYQNFTNNASINNQSLRNCEITGCTTLPAVIYAGEIDYCNIHDNTSTGVQDSGRILNSQIVKNTGTTSSGILDAGGGYITRVANCTISGNGTDGITVTSGSSVCIVENNVFYANGASAAGYGVQAAAGVDSYTLKNNAFGANTSGDIKGVSGEISGTITLTADPFTNRASNIYTLNGTAGGGPLCKAGGTPALLPAGLTATSIDVGASQSAGGGTTNVVIIGRRRKTTRLSPAVKKKRKSYVQAAAAFFNVIVGRRRKTTRLPPVFKKKRKSYTASPPIIVNVVVGRRRKTMRAAAVFKKKRKSPVNIVQLITSNVIVGRRRRTLRQAACLKKKRKTTIRTLGPNVIVGRRRKTVRAASVFKKKKRLSISKPPALINVVVGRRRKVSRAGTVFVRRHHRSAPISGVACLIAKRRRKGVRGAMVFVKPRRVNISLKVTNVTNTFVIVNRKRRKVVKSVAFAKTKRRRSPFAPILVIRPQIIVARRRRVL